LAAGRHCHPQIVNERVTNAIKHAFHDGSGTIRIGLRRPEPDRAVITIEDDGASLPVDVIAGRRSGLGLKLVRRLAVQLGGNMDLEAAAKRFMISLSVSTTASH
jgi:two-component sensor histidine kinase